MNKNGQWNIWKYEHLIISFPLFLLIVSAIFETADDYHFKLLDYEDNKNMRMMYGLSIGCAVILLMPMLFAARDFVVRTFFWVVFFFTPLAFLSWHKVIDYNCSKDLSKPKIVSAKVVMKDKSSGRGRTIYTLVVRNKSYDERALRVSVASEFFDIVKQDDNVQLKIRNGYLGYKWLESYNKEQV